MTQDDDTTPQDQAQQGETPQESGEFSVSGILSAIRQRVTAETGARYARDTALMQREMLVLQPEARIDEGPGETIAASGITAPKPATQDDAALEARVLEILMKALQTPDSPLRAALRSALNDELGGG